MTPDDETMRRLGSAAAVTLLAAMTMRSLILPMVLGLFPRRRP